MQTYFNAQHWWTETAYHFFSLTSVHSAIDGNFWLLKTSNNVKLYRALYEYFFANLMKNEGNNCIDGKYSLVNYKLQTQIFRNELNWKSLINFLKQLFRAKFLWSTSHFVNFLVHFANLSSHLHENDKKKIVPEIKF